MTFIIAEAGVNHNGDIQIAKKLIEIAKDAGADAVKFQTFKASNIVSKTAPKAKYQLQTTSNDESQLEMIRKLELSLEDHIILKKYCNEIGIEFLSTPFDLESIEVLVNQVGVNRIKIPSGEIINGPHLFKSAQTGLPIILSTGMATLSEIENALAVLSYGLLHITETQVTLQDCYNSYASADGQSILKEKVSLLHCTTEYPALYNEINLKVMDTFHMAFGLNVGYSDHSEGIHVSVGAVARGAQIIEKHFTIDKNMPGPDHKASIEPHELKLMVKSIRDIEMALGESKKFPTLAEIKNKGIVRKSLVAAHDIAKGELFTSQNLTTKRPGTGVSPMLYWEFIGKPANKNYAKDELVVS